MNQEKIKLVLVSENDLIRQGMIALCLKKDYDILGAAKSAQSAFDLVRATFPEVVVVDLKEPQWLLNRLKLTFPLIKLLVRGSHYALADACFSEDNQDFFLKTLLSLNKMVLAQRQQPQPKLLKIQAIPYYLHLINMMSFSQRELDILTLLSYGYDNQAIASELKVSLGTVKYHINKVLCKLEASDRSQAVVIALRGGLIS
jgi:DNA-binding NarL/FixJ family response regulator